MSPLYTGIGGVRKEITEMSCGINGVKRDMSEMWAGISGVKRQIFSGVKWNVEVSMGGMNFQSSFYITINGEKIPWEYNSKKQFYVPNGTVVTVSTPDSSGPISSYITWSSNTIRNQLVESPFSFVVDSDVQITGLIIDMSWRADYQWTIMLNRDGLITGA